MFLGPVGRLSSNSGVVWARVDRPARMLVEWSTRELQERAARGLRRCPARDRLHRQDAARLNQCCSLRYPQLLPLITRLLEISFAIMHISGMKQLTCKCGAIYEVTENEVPFKGPDRPPKCVLCESELTWSGPNPQLHLIRHPDQDRE
jgi:hypothetical protein